MIWEILGYEFEIDRDGDEHTEEVGSNLRLALEKMTSDSYLIATYQLRTDDGITHPRREELSFKEIAQLSEPEILEKIEQKIRTKHIK